MSETWQYFRRLGDPLEKAECIKCGARLSCRGSSTSGLIRHLQNKHQTPVQMYVKNSPKPRHPRTDVYKDGELLDGANRSVLNSSTASINNKSPTPKRKYKKRCLAEPDQLEMNSSMLTTMIPSTSTSTAIAPKLELASHAGNIRHSTQSGNDKVARLIALYEVSCKALLDQSLVMINRCLNKHIILDQINTQYDFFKHKVIENIRIVKAKQLKFSMSFDFWPSYKNRCFISIDLFAPELHENLGLLRVHSLFDAEKIFTVFCEKLAEFEIDLNKDIVGITSNCPDEIPIIRQLELVTPVIYNRCYSDLIHQCLLNVFFKNDDLHSYDQTLMDDSDVEDNFTECSDYYECEVMNKQINFLLLEVRKIIHFFREPNNQKVLQMFVAQKSQKNIELVLNNERDWSTIYEMLENFISIHDCIEEAYKHLNTENLNANFQELLLQVKDIHKIFELMVVTMRAFDKPGLTLIRSETILSFMFKNLIEMNNNVAQSFYEQLQHMIQTYRNHNLVSVMKYLMNKNMTTSLDLPLVDQELINQHIKKYASNFVDLKPISTCMVIKKEIEIESPLTAMDLMERLEQEMFADETPALQKYEFSQDDIIGKELAVFQNNDVLGENLTYLFDCLKTIRPTATCPKKIFSTARIQHFHKWPGMSCSTRNKLWFLRQNYLKESKVG